MFYLQWDPGLYEAKPFTVIYLGKSSCGIRVIFFQYDSRFFKNKGSP